MSIHPENNGKPDTTKGPAPSNASKAFNEAGLGSEAAAADERVPLQTRRIDNSIESGPQTVNARWFRSVPRAQTSQVISEARKTFEKALEEFQTKSVDLGISYRFDSIDSTTPGVKIGALLTLAHFETDAAKKVMLCFVSLLEGSVGTLGLKDVTPKSVASFNRGADDGRRQVFKQQTADDYATESFAEAIMNKLRGTYGNDYEITIVGAMTISRNVDLGKDIATVHSVLVNVIGALETHVGAIYTRAQALTIRDVAGGNATASIVMDHSSVPLIGAAGEPIRKDVTLTLRSSQRSPVYGEPDESTEVVQAMGYIDLLYTEPTQIPTANQRPVTQRFTPFFLLTNLTSVDWNLITVETQLLALGLTPVMAYGEQYLAPLMNRATQDDPDHDAGALGYIVNYGEVENATPSGKEPTSKMATKDQLDMLRMGICESLHVAMVVDKSGPLSWMNGLFVDAANGDADAEYAIIQAADNLTGKIFSQKWGTDNRNALFSILRGGKHVGHYTKSNGEVRSLDDLDTLWALNTYGDKNIDRAFDYMETYLQDGDEIVQMANRWKFITDRYPSATLVSTAVLVEPTAAFLECLVDSITAAGLPLRAATVLQDFSGTRGRASYHGSRGLDSSVIAGSLNRSYGTSERRGGSEYNSMGMNQSRFQRR